MPFIIIGVIILIILLSTTGYAKVTESQRVMNEQWSNIVTGASQFHVPLVRVAAMCVWESSGNPQAIGLDNERGLMQITTGALYDVNRVYGLGVFWDDLFDPQKNILVGCAYLKICEDGTGDIDKGTQAYNAGIGRVTQDATAGLTYLHNIQAVENTINHLLYIQSQQS